MKKHAVVVFVMLLLAGCAPKGEPAKTETAPKADDSAAAEASIRSALQQWVEAANRGDFNAALKVWAPDLIGWYPGIPDTSYAQQAAYAAHPPAQAPATYKLSVDEVMVSGPMAVVRTTWIVTVNGQSTTIRSFEVWRKQADGSWKIARYLSAPT